MNDNPGLEELKRHPKVLDLYLSRVRMRKEGSRYKARCPFHREDTPSFDVHISNGVWLYGCFGCGVSGNIFQFIQKTDSVDFKEAVRIVREATSPWYQAKETVSSLKSMAAEEPKVTYPLVELEKYERALAESTTAQTWLIEKRGISYATAKTLRIGYRQDMGSADTARGGWIVFPSIEGDRVTSVKYRSLASKDFRSQAGMEADLFNVKTIDFLEPVYLTEGQFDAAVLEQAGFRAVSLPNATMTVKPEWKDALLRAECIILAGDTDEAGVKAMNQLWLALERTYMLKWPSPMKDANQTFLEFCKRDVARFRAEVERLTAEARFRPMDGVYDVRQSLLTSSHTGLIDHPDRFRFPWRSVDGMAIITPGTVTTIYSTDSGMGKSSLVLQATLHAAMNHNEVVVNYQAEMMPAQIDTIVTSHLLGKDRLKLVEEDYRSAGRMLGSNVQYYIGRNTSLTTLTEVLDLLENAIKRFGATVVVLDNLHFLARNEADPIKAQANAMQRITNLAGSYSVKFILVHQARKADQNHKRKVTHVSDLDGSKAVQNDSSFVFSMHREEVKHSKTDETNSEHEYDPITEIRLQKAREKGPGNSYAKLLFMGSISTFSELSYEAEPDNLFTQPRN